MICKDLSPHFGRASQLLPFACLTSPTANDLTLTHASILPFASGTSEIAVEIGPSCGWSPGQSGAVSQDIK